MTALPDRCTAFSGVNRLTAGAPAEVAVAIRRRLAQDPDLAVLVFDDSTGRPVDFDLRGSDDDVRARLPAPSNPPTDEETPRGRGRPKLGVVAREVTLLPRHWEWLNDQPGGASVALRKLVEAARAANRGKDDIRRAQAAAGRVMLALAGDAAGYEEATRALYAGDRARFEDLIGAWAADARAYVLALAAPAFDP